jgi:periodic tryptophan protein 2
MLQWSEDASSLLSSSIDMTARISYLNLDYKEREPQEGVADVWIPKRLYGHKDAIVAAYWCKNMEDVLTVCRDGACFLWKFQPSFDGKNDRYVAHEKFYCSNSGSIGPAKIKAAQYHRESGMLLAGFDTGVSGMWEMPSFELINTLRYPPLTSQPLTYRL